MINNFFKPAFRYLFKNKLFAILNIAGLSAGIAAFIVITLFLQEQGGYENHIPEAERIFRLVGIQEPAGLENQHVAFTSGGWAEIAKENFPEVEDVFRIMGRPGVIVKVGGELFREPLIYRSEGKIIEWFNYEIVDGTDPSNMLSEPNQAVITSETAMKFYDSVNVTGNTFEVGEKLFRVTGVINTEGIKTHQEMDIILSFATYENDLPYLSHLSNNSLTSYFVLESGANPAELEEKINEYYTEWGEEGDWSYAMRTTFYLQPVKDIYLYSDHLKFQMANKTGSVNHVYIFSIVAVLILAIACINYINLATARSSARSREVGLKKVLGATPGKLSVQFISESLLITFFAIILALVITELTLPYFNSLLGTDFRIDFAGNILFSVGLTGLFLIPGFLSGIYPAMILSRYQPSNALKPEASQGISGSLFLRKILVVSQFVISSALILSTGIIFHQVIFMNQKDKGFKSENVAYIQLNREFEPTRIRDFKNALLNIPEISGTGSASNYNGVAGRQSSITVADSLNKSLMVRFGYVDNDFFPVMETDIVEGRNFSTDYVSDPYRTIIINEAAAKTLGWEDPAGKEFVNSDYPGMGFERHTVIGVVKDYNYYSLHSPVEPAVYIFDPGMIRTVNIRFNDKPEKEIISQIEAEFNNFFPDSYFELRFVEETIKRHYQDEANLLTLFRWFAFLCIIISCLGLFGLTLFVVDQKRKEIGIRKVLGGSVFRINILLMKKFAVWITFAALVSFPLTYLIIQRWLENYSYTITIGWYHFAGSFLVVSLIALIAISPLTTRSAMENPVNTLRY